MYKCVNVFKRFLFFFFFLVWYWRTELIREIVKDWLDYLSLFILNEFSIDTLSECPNYRLRTTHKTKIPQKVYKTNGGTFPLPVMS